MTSRIMIRLREVNQKNIEESYTGYGFEVHGPPVTHSPRIEYSSSRNEARGRQLRMGSPSLCEDISLDSILEVVGTCSYDILVTF